MACEPVAATTSPLVVTTPGAVRFRSVPILFNSVAVTTSPVANVVLGVLHAIAVPSQYASFVSVPNSEVPRIQYAVSSAGSRFHVVRMLCPFGVSHSCSIPIRRVS